MVGMPSSLTAATGMDALTHAVEAYVSTDANPLTDAAAIKAIDKIVHYLPQAVANGDYMKARSEMAYAQYLAGVAFNNASLGYVHAMAHQLGGYYNLPHGVCNAILLPYVQEFNLIGNLERFAVIAKAMDLNVDGMSPFEAGEACVYGLKTFGRYLGIPQNLRSLGVDPADFEVMAENAMKDALRGHQPQKGHQRPDHCDLPKSLRRRLISPSLLSIQILFHHRRSTLRPVVIFRSKQKHPLDRGCFCAG